MKLYITQTSKFKVWSPAQLIRELGAEALYTDIGCSQNFDFLLMESQYFVKIIFEYPFKNWIIAKKFSDEALYNSNFKVQSLVSRPAHQLGEIGTQAYTDI